MRWDMIERKKIGLIVIAVILLVGSITTLFVLDFINIDSLKSSIMGGEEQEIEEENKIEKTEESEEVITESDERLADLPIPNCFDKDNYMTVCKKIYEDELCDLKVEVECTALEKEAEKLLEQDIEITAGELFGRAQAIDYVKNYIGTDGSGISVEDGLETTIELVYPDDSVNSLILFSPLNGWSAAREEGTDSVYLINFKLKTQREDTIYTWRHDLEGDGTVVGVNEEGKSIIELVNST